MSVPFFVLFESFELPSNFQRDNKFASLNKEVEASSFGFGVEGDMLELGDTLALWDLLGERDGEGEGEALKFPS